VEVMPWSNALCILGMLAVLAWMIHCATRGED
jgi:hypothetical protein